MQGLLRLKWQLGQIDDIFAFLAWIMVGFRATSDESIPDIQLLVPKS